MTETRSPAPATSDEWPAEITLDLEDLTLGEMAEIERQSRRSIDELLTSGRVTRRLVGLWVHASRHFERPLSWQELLTRRLSDVRSSSSPSGSAGRRPRSSDLPSATSDT